MSYVKSTRVLIVVAAMALAACTTPPPQTSRYPDNYPSSPQSSYPQSPQAYARYGYVDSVEVVPATQQGIGVGAVGGAIAGAVLGNTVTHGGARPVGTIGGAVVGGVIGNEIEKRVHPSQPAQYRYRVRMDDGSYQTFSQEVDANVRSGDRVRIENGRVWGS
jgi:outer membrane lipoprotein SlyB